MLAINVSVVLDVQEMADKTRVQIFQESIIYLLCERFIAYITNIRESKTFSCHVTNNTSIVMKLYKSPRANRIMGEPLFLDTTTSIRQDHNDKSHAKQGDIVAVRIEGNDSVKNVQVGRSFGLDERLMSRITRSIKNTF